MTRLIDADALLEFIHNNFKAEWDYPSVEDVTEIIANAPTIQREGWVSVPIEPTEEMKRALFRNLIHVDDEAYVSKAIIAAAPTDKG